MTLVYANIPPPDNKRAVRILLECILVSRLILEWMQTVCNSAISLSFNDQNVVLFLRISFRRKRVKPSFLAPNSLQNRQFYTPVHLNSSRGMKNG